jgi:hypothetical protein
MLDILIIGIWSMDRLPMAYGKSKKEIRDWASDKKAYGT